MFSRKVNESTEEVLHNNRNYEFELMQEVKDSLEKAKTRWSQRDNK